MKHLIIICTLILLVGCSFTPPPMKYLAADIPKNIISTKQQKEYFEVIENKFGFMYRKPQNVEFMVRALQNKANVEILRDADVRIRIPVCLYVLCYAYDTASTGNP